MTTPVSAALDKIDSGFFDARPAKPVSSSLPSEKRPKPGTPPGNRNAALDAMTVEQRLENVELCLGLRSPPVVIPPTHATCAFSGLTLPARFFPSGITGQKPMSQFYNAYRSAPENERAELAIPGTINQADFDKHEAEFFPPDVPLGTLAVRRFLRFAAQKKLGRTQIQMHTNRTHGTGL